MEIFSSIFLHILFLPILSGFCSATDTLRLNETITYGKTLVSSGQTFELGFFSPSRSVSKWYIGIWYKKFPDIIVWVANRENPSGNSSEVLTISPDGDLVLQNITGFIFWSSNSSESEPGTVAQLLESGNLVLRRKDDNTQNYVWQSFDFPSDTLLPGMKLGWNLSTGVNRYLTSWKDESDPSPGDITSRIDNIGMPQSVLCKGSEKISRKGPWNGVVFSGAVGWRNRVFKSIFVYDNEEIYSMTELVDNSIIFRFTVNLSGLAQCYLLKNGESSWTLIDTSQNDQCDKYGLCGANSICKTRDKPNCECLYGFVPKSKSQWDVLDWSSGCVRRIPLGCQQDPIKFLKLGGVQLLDLLQFSLNKSMTLKDCEAECLKNCSCVAYANSDIREGGFGIVYKVWLLWKEGRAFKLANDIAELLPFFESGVVRCIQVGLLCVQKLPQDRPTMASVVVMLSNETVALPQPKEPGFFVERNCAETETETFTSEERCPTQNRLTISVLEAR